MNTANTENIESAAQHADRTAAKDVPPGYKRTEIGVIPEDWEVKHLRDCLDEAPSYGINAAAVPYSSILPTYLRITDISADGRFEPSPRVSVNHQLSNYYLLESGDLVLARTGASVGKSYLYKEDDGLLVFAGFLIRVKPNQSILLPPFLAYLMQSDRYWAWVTTVSVRSGQPGINGMEYGSYVLPLPKTSEQHAITEALSDTDSLIAALDKLIAKKRAVKQGAMQQLLTGKTRLPGFRGEWESVRLGDIVLLHRESVLPAMFEDVLFTHYSLPAFDDKKKPVREIGASIGSNKFRVPSESILVSKLNPRIPRIWMPETDSENQVASTEFLVLTPRNGCSRDFLYWICLSPIFLEQLENGATGTTGSHQRVNPKDALELMLNISLDPVEQRAIAAVLTDMDAEIEALERRRAKTQAIKQGMMQQLLTGRVRLVEAEAV